MIAKLRGIIDSIYEDSCIVDVNGVGYLVACSSRTLSKLVRGVEATLLIETLVREDSISLYGFYDAWEKEWFLTLTKVQGVGAKVCLSILSALTPSQLAQAVAAQDKASFSRASGVGPKLAARLVTELKDKVVTVPLGDVKLEDLADTDLSTTPVALKDEQNDALEDVISALVNLGYQRLEAFKAASKVYASNEDKPVSELIRLSLREFAKKDM
ncbi:MAG TPA: Holliday junction branch migration protein RuvA [Alphaproteobacteria bacterium]|nr:Holliday junction branch migration protein RuvA [Alphaproteobacteria bacterium]